METFQIAIKSLDEAYQEFAETYEALRAGKRIAQRRGVYFTSLDAARRILTPERVALLRAIRAHGPASIYELARTVSRDIKNVQDDLALLHKHGLVRFRYRKEDRRGAKIPEVPFGEIALRIAL